MNQLAKIPYFFSLKKNNSVLFYLGVHHSWNPNDSQFDVIKAKWMAFLSVAKAPLAVVESRGWKTYKNEKEAVLNNGEIGFLAFLAQQSNVSIICFEPTRVDEMKYLIRKFSKEQIEYYYFARVVAQWHRLTKKPDVIDYVSQFLERDRKASGWDDFSFSIKHMKEVHREFFGTNLNFGNADFFQKIENSTREDNPFKEVIRTSGNYRDKAVVDGVKSTWNKGQDLFIVYGQGHALKHEKELRTPNKQF